MLKKNEGLTNFQCSALLASTIIGVVVISLPKTAAVSAQEGAVISTLVAGLLTIIIATCIAALGKRFHNKTIIEYSTLLLGKSLGKLFGAIIIFYYILVASITLRGFSDALKNLLLEHTPLEIIMISMLLTATYLTLNGISGIAKISEIFLPIIVGSLLLVIGLSMNNFDFVNFRPVLMPSISSAIKCIPDLVIGFQGYEILFIMIPFMHDYRKVIPYTVVGVAIPVILYTLLVGMSIGVFGVHITQQLNYPTITLAETITFPGAFMERFDILFVILWIIAAFTTIANLYYMASLTSIRLLGLRHYKVSIYLLSPVIYIAAILPQNTLEIRKVTMLAGYIGIAISFITIGLLFLSWISGKREKENV